MYIMYAGYVVGIFAGCTIWAIVDLPTHPNHRMGALAYLGLIPAVILAVGCEAVLLTPQREKKVIANCLEQGKISGRCAAGIGFAVGIVAFGFLTILVLTTMWVDVLWIRVILLTVIALSIVLAPALGIMWLLRICSKSLEIPKGPSQV